MNKIETAYLEGRQARKEGKTQADNPYHTAADIISRLRWWRGWVAEDHETKMMEIERMANG